MIGAQKKLIVFIAVAVLVLAVAYFAVIRPLVDREEPDEQTPVELLPGEVLGANGRIQLFEQVARADMKSVEVKNASGSYRFVRTQDDKFVIDGHESTLYEATLFSQLVVDTGYALSKTKIADNAAADFYKYGLDEASLSARYTVTTLSGRTHTVCVGNRIATGGGYYVRYEGRDSVYVLDTTLASTVLQPIEAYVTPLVAYPTSLNNYYLIDNFAIFHGEDPEDLFVSFKYLEEKDRSEIFTFTPFAMTYPGEGTYCPSDYLDSALQVFTDFKGTEVLKLAPDEKDSEKWFPEGFSYVVYHEIEVPNDQNDPSKGSTPVKNVLFFSEKHTERGGESYYYCYSAMFDIIVKIPAYRADFLSWDLKLWVHNTIFQPQIDTVGEVCFEYGGKTVTFLLDGTGDQLTVTEKETGHKPLVKNFRQLYKMMLSVTKESTNGLTAEEIAALTKSDAGRQLRMTARMRSGKVLVYDFYPYTDVRSYYSVNGVKCEFFVLRTIVEKLCADVTRVQNDVTVNAEDRY